MAEDRPERIGRYQVVAELGQGAMGIVYQARDPQLERDVAIKTLRRDLGLPPEEYGDLTKRFHQEATAAGRLNHPNIVTIHDVVEIDDRPYIVMELLAGRTLAELIATDGRLAPDRAVELITQVCRALDYAHTHGVIHRDIKPGNIMVTPDGVAKVSDFGIARVAGSSVTRTGVLVGTPAYMSPEQLKGRVPDGRSDLFSLGVVLYEALAGSNPFQNDDLTATLYQVVQVDPPPVRQRNPAVSRALEQVTARVMAKEPEQRYPTARALADALAEARAHPEAVSGATRRPVGTRRRPVVIATAAAVLVLVGLGWALLGGMRERSVGVASPELSSQTFRRSAPAVPALGEIVVATNPAVDVFVDGVPKGRTGEWPLVIADVVPGERWVTLQLGSRRHELPGTVRAGQSLELVYRFPAEPQDMPLDKLFGATRDKLLNTAREKLREVAPERLKERAREKARELGVQ